MELMEARSGFEEFCGDEIFNKSLLLNSQWPHFTECFQNSILVWVPCGWLWLSLTFYLVYMFRYHQGQPIPVNKLNITKTFVSIILCLLSAIQVLQVESDAGRDDFGNKRKVFDVVYVAGGLKAATYLLSGALVQIERIKGVATSGVLWLFWFISVIANVIPFYSKIYLRDYETMKFTFYLFYLSYALMLVQLVLTSFAERLHHDGYYNLGENPSPEQEASFPSRLVFWWINKLVFQGYRKTLQEDDLFSLHTRDKGDRVVPQFAKPWSRELAQAKLKKKYKEQLERYTNGVASFTNSNKYRVKDDGRVTSNVQSDESTSLLSNGAKRKRAPSSYGNATTVTNVEITETKPKNVIQASLFKVLVKTYGFEMLQAHFCKLIYDLLQFVSPLLLTTLIDYTHNLEENKAQGLQWKGYVFASSFFVVSTLGSIMFQQNFHIGMSLGMRIKAALIAAVYRKSLTVSNEAKKESTVGEIVNLMSVDCQRLQDITGYLWMFWSSPLQIVLAMYMLWNVVGVATLAGLAILILLMPINAYISAINRRYQIAQMKFKDERIKLMSEVLNGMKVLKLYAWEPSFQDKIEVIRNKELHILKKAAYLGAFSTFTWTCAPFLVTLGTFATYVLVSETHYLDANKAFVALSLFNILRFPINLLPMMISFIVQANVSVGRIGKFLRQEDLDKDNVNYDKNCDSAIRIQGGEFTWDKSNPSPTLSGISLDIPEGQLIAVVGQVGSGKSSLVSAILGEMEKTRGQVIVKSSVAYVPQQAWIQNATVKDNILFGKDADARMYEKVIDDCALKSDLDILPAGDKTEIGEKGINLSGGQKQRISLARAVYNQADIYLLDDPLSAVDSHVGKHIFNQVISHKGCLQGKTRVLVTHGVHWLPMVDKIVVMDTGRVTEMGSYEELLSHDGDFAQFLKTYLTKEAEETEDEGEEEDPEIAAIKARILERVDSITSDNATSGDEGKPSRTRKLSTQKSTISRQLSAGGSKGKKDDAKDEKKPAKAGEKLVEEEKSATGKVQISVFISYFKAIGVLATALFFSFFAAYQGTNVYSSIWLSQWTADPLLQNTSLSNTTRYENRNYMYLGVYAALGVIQAILVLFYAIIASTRMVKAAGVLHKSMLTNILHNPMAFFDTTPSGRILNRFSRDVDTVDNTLPQQIRSWMNTFFSTLSIIVVISYSTPIFMVVILPLAILYYLIQRFYIPTSRQLKRMESTSRSPIYSNFGETITGATSIRAYKADHRFVTNSKDMVDRNLAFYFAGIASNRWLAVRLEFLGNLLVLAAAMFVVVSENVNESLVGLSISYALQVTGSLNWMVRMTSDLETNIVSVERMKEYSETETEAAWVNPFKRPELAWPQRGSLSFNDYQTRYRPGLDLVLKGLSCNIKGGEKIGIVGRTGAGKSSMTVALFRLIEAAGGSIAIDGISINDIGLHDLRSRITILPQDPVLFSGSLRMNIDPLNEHSDDAIWLALEHAHLKDFALDCVGRLMYECGEGGQNLSVGQRQLVCLARSLLRKTKILVLDEATAAVDMETDDLIQQTIRKEFKSCTVLTIAHRLNTIMDYDRIMVLDQGNIKEMDSPSALLENKSSIFYGMAKDANLV